MFDNKEGKLESGEMCKLLKEHIVLFPELERFPAEPLVSEYQLRGLQSTGHKQILCVRIY